MKHRRAFIFILILLIFNVSYAKVTSNVLINEYCNDFYIETKSDGITPLSVQNKVSATYSALRNPTSAIFYVYYTDFVKIGKVKSKGVKPIYAGATSAGVFFDDSRVCYFPVPLEKILTTSTVSIELTFIKPEFCDLIPLYNIYPIETYRFSLHMPVALKDRFDVTLSNPPADMNVERTVSPNGKEYVITVTAHNLKDIESEDMAPSVRHIAPYITINGFFPGVKELYGSYRSFVSDTDPGAQTVAEKAAEITAGCIDELSKINAIQKWVHENIRYVAIENGELGHAPDLASQVLAKRYGDCKGSSSLMVGMLRSLGIDGRLTWIGTSSIPEDWSTRPSFSTGNHMITSVVLENDSVIFIDGTTGIADFGFIPSSIQGKQALIENGDTYRLERVPVLPAESNTDSIVSTLILNGTSLTGNIDDHLTGSYKSLVLNGLRDADSKNRDKLLVQNIGFGRKNVKLTGFSVENNAPDGGPICLSADIELPNVITTAGEKTYMQCVSLFPETSQYIINTKNRTYPAKLPRRVITSINNITIPDSYTIESVPEPIDINNEWMDASLNYTVEGNEIRCSLRIKFKTTYIPLEKLDEFNNGIRRLSKSISQSVTLKHL